MIRKRVLNLLRFQEHLETPISYTVFLSSNGKSAHHSRASIRMESDLCPQKPDSILRFEDDQILLDEDVKDPEVPERTGSCIMQDRDTGNETVEHPELYLEEYFRDHFTLSTPSSLVRFRSTNTAARVFENRTSQFIMEERIDPLSLRRRIYVKQLSDGTTGLQFLRGIYTVMCVFWTGIFFVFCLQILLVMVLEMTIQVGTTEIHPKLDLFRLLG